MQGARIMARGREGEQRAVRACGVHQRSGTLAHRRPATPAMRIPAIVAAVLLLVACTPEEIVPTEPMALDGVRFEVEALPQAEGACDPAQPFPARVTWDVTDWTDPKFDFLLRSTNGQLFARHNTAKGEHVTDPYGREGLWILLVDRNTRLLVAAKPVPALVCPAD